MSDTKASSKYRNLSIDETSIAMAAVVFGYTAAQMARALEPQMPGECSWLGGCHEPSDPDSRDGNCTRHAAYLASLRPKAVA